MENGARVISRTTHQRIKIYINEILHISIPKADNIKIQAWINDKSDFRIEIRTADHTDWYSYESYILWKSILNELDKHI